MIISFLVANSALLITLGVIIIGGVVALIARDRQKVYTKIYALIVEAEKLELSNEDKFEYVLAKAYSVLPLFIKTFVSEDNVRRAIIYSLTKIKQFTALKMGTTPEAVLVTEEANITEIKKIEEKVVEIAKESKVEVEKIVEDVKLVIEKVSPKEILATLSSEKVLEDVTSGESTEKIISDIVEELPTLEKEAVQNVVEDAKNITETVEDTSAVVEEIKTNETVSPIVEAVTNVITPIMDTLEAKVEPVVTAVEEKITEAKVEVAKVEEEIKVVAEPILPIVETVLPVIDEAVKATGIAVAPEVSDAIAKIKVILANLENPTTF